MADKKEKKGFRRGVYAVISGVIIAVVLIALTIFAYTTRYTALSPEKTAQAYVDGIVQTGDGYNAYKTTLLSKNGKLKYGDFVRNVYMRPYVNDGDDVKQADFVSTNGSVSEEEQKAIDKVYTTMYEYYVDLLSTYGWDNYDAFFTQYFEKLVQVRHDVYGDDYMSMDYMFGVLESNVQTYADSLTGTEEVLAADNKTVISEAKEGEYQKRFGKDYKLTTTATEFKELSAEETKAYIAAYKSRITPVAESGEALADKQGVKDEDDKHKYKTSMVDALKGLDHSEEIDAVGTVTCEVKDESGKVNIKIDVPVVKIGKSWYVDNTNIITTPLYFALNG